MYKRQKQRRSKQKKSKRRRSKQKKIKGGVRFSGQTSICADNGGSNIRSQGLKVSPSELVNKPNSFIINDDKKIKSIDDNKLHKVCSRAEIRYGINSKDCKKMSSHIDFIDNVYENVRAPLNFVCNSINNKQISDKI